jgi:hypothetical protein
MSEKIYIEIVKGHDKNLKPFTVILLLTDKEQDELHNQNYRNIINLMKYNIIYKQIGHVLN